MMRRARPRCLRCCALAGCGLHPLYGGGAAGPVAATLRSVEVAPIAGQSGWLMRNKLVDRLGEAGRRHAGLPARRRRSTTISPSFGLRSDRAATRERRTLRARYQLVELGNGTVVLDATAGSDAGIDVVSSEYATVAAEQTALEQSRRHRRRPDRRAARALRVAHRRGASEGAPRPASAARSTSPTPTIRFYLFHGPDEAQSRALAARLLEALGASRFLIAAGAVKSRSGVARRRSRAR